MQKNRKGTEGRPSSCAFSRNARSGGAEVKDHRSYANAPHLEIPGQYRQALPHSPPFPQNLREKERGGMTGFEPSASGLRREKILPAPDLGVQVDPNPALFPPTLTLPSLIDECPRRKAHPVALDPIMSEIF